MEFMLTLEVISPLLCSRTRIVQAWGRSHRIISDKMLSKNYVAKVLMSKKRKNDEKMARRKEK
jgi:hypothetical protein